MASDYKASGLRLDALASPAICGFVIVYQESECPIFYHYLNILNPLSRHWNVNIQRWVLKQITAPPQLHQYWQKLGKWVFSQSLLIAADSLA